MVRLVEVSSQRFSIKSMFQFLYGAIGGEG